MFFRPLQQFLGEELDFIDVVKTDFMEFFRAYLMVKVNHTVPIARHFSH